MSNASALSGDKQDLTTSSKGRCAGNTPMDSTSIADLRSGVFSIIQEFAEVYELFKKWRRGKIGKRAVGQEECETSLLEGKTAIEGAFKHFSLQHGARFDSGDRKSLGSIVNIRKRFRDAVGDVLTGSVAEKGGNDAKIYPISLHQASETARKETILTMDELSNRILTGSNSPFRVTDPGDVLPPMPLLPLRPTRASQEPPRRSPAGSAASSQTSLGVPFASSPQRNYIYSSASGWKMPKFEDREDSSTSLVTWMFPPKPTRSYHDIVPLEPTPAVVPSFKCDEDSYRVLEEGEAAVQRLWAAANNTIAEERSRLYPHSAPMLQGPWASIWEDEPDPRPRTPLLYEREATPPTPEEAGPSLLLSPAPPIKRPASAQAGKSGRSELMLEFSTPAPRFRRHVSGPSDARG